MEYSEQERTENLEHVLRIKDGRIYPAQALKAFMITTNPVIAKSDCLFYAVKATGEPIFLDPGEPLLTVDGPLSGISFSVRVFLASRGCNGLKVVSGNAGFFRTNDNVIQIPGVRQQRRIR
jgi:hypothetical protein